MIGTVKRLVRDRGFGFITTGDNEFFFHRSAVVDAFFEDLTEGTPVLFEPGQSTKGPRAEQVRIQPPLNH